MSDDLAPSLQEFIDDIAESQGLTSSMLRSQLERQLGLDLSEVGEEDASEFIEAIEEDEFETACDILREHGVDDEQIEMFREQLEAAAEQQDGEAGNSDSPESSTASDSGGSGLSEAEIDKKIQEATPSATEIASELKSQLGGQAGGGGGGGGGGQQAQSEGDRMGQLISLVQLMNQGGGGGAMGEMGEKATERVMERTMQRLAEPSFGEKIGKQIEDRAAEQVATGIVDDMDFSGNKSDDDENDDTYAELTGQ